MILVGIGANLVASGYDSVIDSCEAAIGTLEAVGLPVAKRSRWYRSAPVPPSAQPWFVNGVIEIRAPGLEPADLLAWLQQVEERFGRRRDGGRNAPRTLDLDLLDVGGHVSRPDDPVILPHPRLHKRAFVLLPLAEVAPGWRHPVSHIGIDELILGLPKDQVAIPLPRE